MTEEKTIKQNLISSNKKIKLPKKYKVLLHNDDVTPIEFVIVLLMSVFNHDEKQATTITMSVHEQGKGVAGIYNYEIAEQKVIDGSNLCRTHGWPLVISLEEE